MENVNLMDFISIRIFRINNKSGSVLQYIQHVLFIRFGHMASTLFETIFQGKETHRINQLYAVASPASVICFFFFLFLIQRTSTNVSTRLSRVFHYLLIKFCICFHHIDFRCHSRSIILN